MALSILDLTDDRPTPAPFFAVANEVYAGDPNYCAPFRDAVAASIGRADFHHRQQVLIAVENGRPVARLIARLSPVLRDAEGRPFGLLAFFEACERPEAVATLFATAIAWLRDHGAGAIVGPMDGDTWHSYRLNVGPYGERPFLMEPYQPPYYPALWEQNGFEVLEGYHSKRVNDLAGVLPQLEPSYRRALAAGYRLERLGMKRFVAELERFHALSCEIFRHNFLYSEISRSDFVKLYSGARRLIDPDFVYFAVAPDGSDAGFLFAFPDRFRAVAAMHGRRGPLAALRFLAHRRRPDTVNLKSLGVVSPHRRSGLAAALMYCGYRTAREKGYTRANLCLIKDDNPSGGLEGGLGTLLRRYHLYQLGGSR
ncbi:MAG: hypothetical protein GY856_33830 [bacterium]|nr:hypothetical protein [bacterium]